MSDGVFLENLGIWRTPSRGRRLCFSRDDCSSTPYHFAAVSAGRLCIHDPRRRPLHRIQSQKSIINDPSESSPSPAAVTVSSSGHRRARSAWSVFEQGDATDDNVLIPSKWGCRFRTDRETEIYFHPRVGDSGGNPTSVSSLSRLSSVCGTPALMLHLAAQCFEGLTKSGGRLWTATARNLSHPSRRPGSKINNHDSRAGDSALFRPAPLQICFRCV